MATTTLAERAEILRPLGLTPLLTPAELEAYYGVSGTTVKDWVRRGCPTEPTNFRGNRFDLDRVRAWVAQDANTAA